MFKSWPFFARNYVRACEEKNAKRIKKKTKKKQLPGLKYGFL